MGFFSWVSSCNTVGEPDPPHGLGRTNLGTAEQDEVHRAAAEDVAWIRQDDKYFGHSEEDDL